MSLTRPHKSKTKGQGPAGWPAGGGQAVLDPPSENWPTGDAEEELPGEFQTGGGPFCSGAWGFWSSASESCSVEALSQSVWSVV